MKIKLIKFLPSLFSSRLALNHKVRLQGEKCLHENFGKQGVCNASKDNQNFRKKGKGW